MSSSNVETSSYSSMVATLAFQSRFKLPFDALTLHAYRRFPSLPSQNTTNQTSGISKRLLNLSLRIRNSSSQIVSRSSFVGTRDPSPPSLRSRFPFELSRRLAGCIREGEHYFLSLVLPIRSLNHYRVQCPLCQAAVFPPKPTKAKKLPATVPPPVPSNSTSAAPAPTENRQVGGGTNDRSTQTTGTSEGDTGGTAEDDQDSRRVEDIV